MAINLTVNEQVFAYPQNRDKNWGIAATGWATAVTNLVAQFRSASAPFADAGVIRLGSQDDIAWRNFANSDNVRLFVDVDDILYYQNGSDPAINLVANAAGNVTGPVSSTNNAVVLFDGTSGQTIKDSATLIADIAVPIGTIIAHYDFNGALVPNPAYWVPCDGGTYTIGGSSRVTPDLSGLYMVGFGTIGAGDIDTAPWATAAVGNTNHQVNIAHTHTGPLHQHGIASETSFSTNPESGHVHDAGGLYALIDNTLATNKIYTQQIDVANWSISVESGVGSTLTPGGNASYGTPVGGDTGAPTPHSHTMPNHDHSGQTANGGNGATGSALSATQSIQPQSIRVRYFMRAA